MQSLPIEFHAQTTANVARTVAPGGTLLVIATARDEAGPADGLPWPLSRAEVKAFAGERLETVRIEEIRDPGVPARWRAEFRRVGPES